MNNIKRMALIILAVLLFSACQPTPDTEVVNQRIYEKLLEENTSKENKEYPETLSDEFESKDGKVKIIFDAEIITPDVDKFPVIQIDPQPISDEIIQIVVDEFMEGETGYYPESYMTKSEIEDKLLYYYAKLNNEELIEQEYEKYMPYVDIDYDAVRENIKNRIAEYTEMLADAPEVIEHVMSYLNFRTWDFYTTDDYEYINEELSMTQEELDFREENQEENLYLVSDRLIGDEHLRLIVYSELPTLLGQPHNFGLHSKEHYEVHFIRARNDYLTLMGDVLSSADSTSGTKAGAGTFDEAYPELNISEEEAVELAEQTLAEMGLDNYYLAYSRIIPAFATAEEYEAFYNLAAEDESISYSDYFEYLGDKFYFLTFKPIYYGIPLIHASNQFSQQELVSLPFAFEEIKIKVSNDSVVEFKWVNPTDVSNVLNEDANLLSFDEIAKIAKEHMKLKYNIETLVFLPEDFPNYEEELANFLSAEIIITEIRLGLGGVAAYNNTDEYMLIPVWSFYGSYKYDCADDQYEDVCEDTFVPLISINAVDGSIIDQLASVDYN